MKKWIIPCLLLMFYMPVRAEEPTVSAKSAVLIEYATGKIVWGKNENDTLPMASTTKIMTALLALETAELTDMVTISRRAAGVEGSSMYLKAGEKLSMEDLLYGLMLSSGNDAAVAIAEHIAGTEGAFAERMTKRAKELGCTNTQFKNANGLPDSAHYTTAFELARITGKALQNAKFREIVSAKSARIGGRQLTNHNKLLSMYEGAIGVKTGFTKASGRTLVSAAARDGIELIAVTLNAPDDWDDHIKMLDFGFSNMERRCVITAKETAGKISVLEGNADTVEICFSGDFALSVIKGEKTEIKLCLPPSVKAPLAAGTEVGKAEVFLEGVKMGEISLVTKEEITPKPKPTIWEYLTLVFRKWQQIYAG